MTYKQETKGEVVFLPRRERQPKFKVTPDLARLMHMLTFKRPDGSATEKAFVATFIDTVPGVHADAAGNRWLQIGDNPEILWSCHTDTVHHGGGLQRLFLRGPMVYSTSGDALGADDTAGCWLMLEMIKAGVEGVYVFHRGEEVGGIGSMWIKKNRAAWLTDIKAAIAFDRKGYDSVITHQLGRCCSKEFAESLAAILGGKYAPDETGLFTDTANYTGLIGECSNISVGYFDAHSGGEHLDLEFIRNLRDTLIAADFSKLVYKREAGEEDEDWGWYGGSYYNGGRSYGSYDRDRDCGYVWNNGWKHRGGGNWKPLAGEALVELVRAHPEKVADMLEQDGWDAEALADHLDIERDADLFEDDHHA